MLNYYWNNNDKYGLDKSYIKELREKLYESYILQIILLLFQLF